MLLGFLLSSAHFVLCAHILRLLVCAVGVFNYIELGGFKMMETERIKRHGMKAEIVETLTKVGNLGAQHPPA